MGMEETQPFDFDFQGFPKNKFMYHCNFLFQKEFLVFYALLCLRLGSYNATSISLQLCVLPLPPPPSLSVCSSYFFRRSIYTFSCCENRKKKDNNKNTAKGLYDELLHM